MLEVLLSAELYGRGGTETHLLNLCRLLREMRANVTLVSRVVVADKALVNDFHATGTRLISTPFARRRDRLRASQLYAYATTSLLLSRKHDVLYTLGVGRFTSFLKKFVKPTGRLIWHPFGDPKDIASISPTIPAGLVDVAIAESRIHEAALLRSLGARTQIMILPALAQTTSARERTAQRKEGLLRVAFLGRYDENKGAPWLLQHWPSHLAAQTVLEFHGEGVLRPQLLEIQKARGLPNISINGGWSGAEELAAIMERVDLVVLPSLSEGIPLVLLESMAYGVPFVASDVGGIPELADGNPDVRIAPRGESFLRAVEEMLTAIRRGNIDNSRLQRYFNSRFDQHGVKTRWRSFLENTTP